MATNGSRRPPRPRIEMLCSPPPPEAAAVIAAVERFLADTAPVPDTPRPASPWQRAALLEGVRAKQALGTRWGEPRGWGARHGR